MHWDIPSLRSEKLRKPEPLQKMFLSENVIFRGLRLRLGHFGHKAPEALCLSFKMVYQRLLYLLSLWTYWHLKLTQGPTHFLIANCRGC